MRDRIPMDTLARLDAYQNDRRPPGGFLTAVLANDLYAAVRRADLPNYRALKYIVGYVNEHLPADCRGSAAAVVKWLAAGTGPDARATAAADADRAFYRIYARTHSDGTPETMAETMDRVCRDVATARHETADDYFPDHGETDKNKRNTTDRDSHETQ